MQVILASAVSEALMLDEGALGNNVSQYEKRGIDSLFPDNYTGYKQNLA